MNNDFSFVAVSSRVRLARNLVNYPFGPQHAGNGEIVDLVTRTVKPLGDFDLVRISSLTPEQAGYLKEKYIVSPLLASNKGTGAVVIGYNETVSIMINEEDHLRLQCVLSGLCPEEAYDNLRYLDGKLSERMSFAFDDGFGFITACMTNLGTGMRASVMLFLPALTASGQISALIAEMKSLGLTVRGAYGEGSEAEGCFYQVSNEVTLGYSEAEILKMVSFAARKLCELELIRRREDIEAKLDILRDALEKTKSSIASPIIRDAMKKAVPSFVDPEEINKAAEGSDEMKMINSKNPQATE